MIDGNNNIDQMVQIFTQNITESLDEVAPLKTFTVRSHHKFGISEETTRPSQIAGKGEELQI